MNIVYERKAGETFTMGPFANGMRVAMLLQPKAGAATGNRLTKVRFRHRTGPMLQKEVTIVVDAAAKAPPLLELKCRHIYERPLRSRNTLAARCLAA